MSTYLVLKSQFETPLGKMVALSDCSRLFLLTFLDKFDLKAEIKKLGFKGGAKIKDGYFAPTQMQKKK